MVTRAAAVIKLCKGLPAYLAQARANLQLPIPRTWIDTALMQTKGMVEFADKDVRNELTKKADIPLANQAEIDPALDTCKAALTEHAAWLAKQQPQGTNDFSLGPTKSRRRMICCSRPCTRCGPAISFSTCTSTRTRRASCNRLARTPTAKAGRTTPRR